ncbi:SDR family NAD(P)-dependent oxidoreductase [Pontibacter pamirensis]|uniref:SDR family NAD(P)-dependent oxidoreductase n=1 Tax=Pontibacter pamirensis TaxID=2562824 RepID=UPI001389E43A|nr:SDR family NAD(P)-dependent oxidoreductase [Pontibacter pamirensis]
MALSSFSNTVVVVTGAASGIGRELALQAAGRGAVVVATDINYAGLTEMRETAWQQGAAMVIHELNVADREAVLVFAQTVISRIKGHRLVLINNAGVALFSGSFHHTDLKDFEALFQVNLWGTINMTKAFYPYFMEMNEGHIVNLSSVFGLGGVANQAAYCTSKFAVRGFTETLRMELLGTGVFTTAVHPGGIKTNIVKAAFPKGPVATAAMHRISVKSFEQTAKTTPEEAARLILDAVEKKKQRLVIGSDGKIIDLVTRLFPVSYTSILKKQFEQVFANPYKNRSERANRNRT